jgi:hypothetical protein
MFGEDFQYPVQNPGPAPCRETRKSSYEKHFRNMIENKSLIKSN